MTDLERVRGYLAQAWGDAAAEELVVDIEAHLKEDAERDRALAASQQAVRDLLGDALEPLRQIIAIVPETPPGEEKP